MNIVEFLFFVSCAIVVLGGVYLIGFNYGVKWSLKKYAEIEAAHGIKDLP